MHPFSLPLLFLFSLLHATTACNTTTFPCGPFTDLSYPFSTTDSTCGPPDFKLTCTNNLAELNINSLSYRVIDMKPFFIIARTDLYNNTCTSNYSNSTTSTYFTSDLSSNEPLTLFYNCSDPISFPPNKTANKFACQVTGANNSDAYYLTGPVPSDPVLKFVNCNIIITVPVLASAAEELKANRMGLKEALMKGFSMNYTVPNEKECERCLSFGGNCGFDSSLGKFGCYCDGVICHPPGDGNCNSALPIGLGVAGAAVVCIFLGILIFFVRRRKRQIVTQSMNKDFLAPPSSKTLLSRTSDFYRRTPSQPTTKADVEKASTYFGIQVFDYFELEEATDNFSDSKELGEGGFGTVYYGELSDGRAVAVKRLYEQNYRTAEQFINEVEILSRMRHKSLVSLYGCTSRRSQRLLLVYEYIPNGTVADHLHGKRSTSGALAWSVRLSIAIETADALAYLHASEIIHRDVKTNNILLDNDFCVKVADFGLSRLFPTAVTHVSTAPQGTPGYVDPEYYQTYQLTTKSDVYSFGVVLMELLSSKEAVDTNRHRQDINLANMAITKIQNGSLHELVDPCLGFETDNSVRRMATRVAELGFRCLQQDKDMRPTMKEVLETLEKIEKEGQDSHNVDVADIETGEIGQPKSSPLPFSPNSVVTAKWTSFSTTPTASSG